MRSRAFALNKAPLDAPLPIVFISSSRLRLHGWYVYSRSLSTALTIVPRAAIYTVYTSPTHPPIPNHLPTLIVTPHGMLFSYCVCPQILSSASRTTQQYPLLLLAYQLCTRSCTWSMEQLSPCPLECRELSADAVAARRPLCREALPSSRERRQWKSYRVRPRSCILVLFQGRPLRSLPKPEMDNNQHRRPLSHLQACASLSGLRRSPAFPSIETQPQCAVLEYVLLCLRRA